MSEPSRSGDVGLIVIAVVWLLWFALVGTASTTEHAGLFYLGWFLGGPLAVAVTVIVLIVMCVRAVLRPPPPRR